MPKSCKSKKETVALDDKAPFAVMTEDRKREVVAQLTDDVLSKLVGAFFDVSKMERWTKRDLATISGINETAINHILAGRRKNLTVETIALLTRAMGTRPELVLHDSRPTGNQPHSASLVEIFPKVLDTQESARASALQYQTATKIDELQKVTSRAAGLAYSMEHD
jgi:hypothetical protein